MDNETMVLVIIKLTYHSIVIISRRTVEQHHLRLNTHWPIP
jgi:hypothetical protein